MEWNRYSTRLAAAACAVAWSASASADVTVANWNWSNWTNWGYCNLSTMGQTFKGNGEVCTGARFRQYYDGCCATVPFRALVCRWDPINRRAIGPILAQGDAVFHNYGGYWSDKEVSFTTRAGLAQGEDYVVFFTVAPWWGNYSCYTSQPAVNPGDTYPQGELVYLYNSSDQNAWFNSTWGNVGYDLNVTVRTTNDCDSNGIVDANELAAGTALDCNADGVIDSCEQLAPFAEVRIGDEQGPIGAAASVSYDFERVIPAQGDVQLQVEAIGDLSATHEFLIVSVNGGPAHALFTAAESDCNWLSQTITISRDEFNAAIANDALRINVSGSATVDAAACKGESKVRIRLDYTEAYRDCNDNLINDSDDFCSGLSLDCNGNRVPDECDLASGSSQDVDSDAMPDECQIDCNNDARPDAFQIFVGEVPDCNGNAIPDQCDLYAAGASDDCNSNGVPDECDIASEPLLDCDLDALIDSCALSAGTVPDCNGNSVPDACDIASGFSMDCDGDARPDSCNIEGVWEVSPRQQPFDQNQTLSYLVPNPTQFPSDVTFQVQYLAATYGQQGYNIYVYVDGNYYTSFYDQYWGGCASNTRQFTIPQSTWSQYAADGSVEIRVVAGPWNSCGGSFCQVNLFRITEDCNSNAIPDLCDISSGFDHDCNNNGDLDSCDIVAGAEDDNKNGYPDPCELDRGDVNLDGNVDAADLSVVLSYWGAVGFPIGDLNHDGFINAMDIAILLDHWGERF